MPHEEATMTERPPARSSARPARGVQLDETSKQIIEQLQQDGRRSYAAIGKAVGLSEAAVRQRVQKLLDTGVMQIVGVTDPLSLGFSRQMMIGVKCEGDLEKVADELAAVEEIDYVVITAGSFDILLELVCESDEQLLELLGRIRTVPGVVATESFVYLKLRKQTYSWGTR
jgi:Lrp/AsnC family transcriptional regulator for asnA, asnC and gidA